MKYINFVLAFMLCVVGVVQDLSAAQPKVKLQKSVQPKTPKTSKSAHSAKLEERVSQLEKDMQVVKSRLGIKDERKKPALLVSVEKRVRELEQELAANKKLSADDLREIKILLDSVKNWRSGPLRKVEPGLVVDTTVPDLDVMEALIKRLENLQKKSST